MQFRVIFKTSLIFKTPPAGGSNSTTGIYSAYTKFFLTGFIVNLRCYSLISILSIISNTFFR